MEGQLKVGTIMDSERGNTYKIISLLGAGGQGEVYEVERDEKHYALKWYFEKSATEEQEKILANLIEQGAPDKCFLWPEDLVYGKAPKRFGYIMPLRPKEYKGFVDLLKNRVNPSFFNLCKAAYNLTRGYYLLHQKGYSYHDISDKNVFFNPNNGEVLICDNDNVSVNGIKYSGVNGTPRFMAPEIVNRKAKPSRNTDLYSLAVLLFYMFMIHHPLEGKLEADIKCMDEAAMNKLYGTNPVFIFDPDNTKNRPVKGYQDNALIYWPLYPQKIRDLFISSFTVGLYSPDRRITEKQWLDAIANMMNGIFHCPNCGMEIFYDESKITKKLPHVCWNCGKLVRVPPRMEIKISPKRFTAILEKNGYLYSHLVYEDTMDKIIGTVVQNPKNQNIVGLQNRDNVNWTYIRPDGSQIPLAIGRSAALLPGAKINFGKALGEIFE